MRSSSSREAEDTVATMKALVKTGPGGAPLELQDIPVPEIGDEDILMQVTHCGVCGSDLHMETGLHTCDPPVVLGHEYTGVVAKLGADVTGLDVGQPVSFLNGPNPYPGVSADGGFAEYMRLPAKTVWPTPEGLSPEEASQFETVILPMFLVRDAVRVQPGERVVVSGPGQIGLLAANIAKLEGAGHVLVLGAPGDELMRLPLALEMGADDVGVMTEAALAGLGGDNAPDCWIEASGAAQAIEASVRCVKRSGRISLSGLGPSPALVDLSRVAWNNVSIRGVWGGPTRYIQPAAELMLRGELKMKQTITDVMPLAEWREAFAMLRRREAVKILLDPRR